MLVTPDKSVTSQTEGAVKEAAICQSSECGDPKEWRRHSCSFRNQLVIKTLQYFQCIGGLMVQKILTEREIVPIYDLANLLR